MARELDLMLPSQALCHSRVHLDRFWLKEGTKRERLQIGGWGLFSRHLQFLVHWQLRTYVHTVNSELLLQSVACMRGSDRQQLDFSLSGCGIRIVAGCILSRFAFGECVSIQYQSYGPYHGFLSCFHKFQFSLLVPPNHRSEPFQPHTRLRARQISLDIAEPTVQRSTSCGSTNHVTARHLQ